MCIHTHYVLCRVFVIYPGNISLASTLLVLIWIMMNLDKKINNVYYYALPPNFSFWIICFFTQKRSFPLLWNFIRKIISNILAFFDIAYMKWKLFHISVKANIPSHYLHTYLPEKMLTLLFIMYEVHCWCVVSSRTSMVVHIGIQGRFRAGKRIGMRGL